MTSGRLLLFLSFEAVCIAALATTTGETQTKSGETITASVCEAGANDPAWNRMEVLPGVGWDNLRSKDMGMVFEYDYSQCQLTNDRKFLLPDGCFATPVQQSDVETFSELIAHWDKYSSLTASSISAGASFFSMINAKFSNDYTKAKTTMANEKSFVARVQIRHKLYIVRLQTGATKLHSTFRRRLLDIAEHMMNNNTNIARYLSELLVRDYGTHYVSAVHAGAILVQEDYVKNTFAYNSEESKSKITASASANFFGKVGFSSSFTHSTDEKFQESYSTNRTYSHIRTIGGPPYRIDFTVDKWEDGLADSLVAIDREGDPLHFTIIPEAITELPPLQVLELSRYVEKAINSYYKHNTRRGCTQPGAGNFYFSANVDDGSCKAPSNNYTFGGLYQTCQHTPSSARDIICPQLLQKNPLTGDYGCPDPYQAVLLHAGVKTGSYITQQCDRHCHGWLFRHCSTNCYNVHHPVTGHYEMYWCVANGPVPEDSGYLFGGLYNSINVNPVTQTKSCPNHYYPLQFGEDTKVCVSDDYELGYPFAIPFAGFESCNTGNPLAMKSSSNQVMELSFGKLDVDPGTWPHRCPTGYSQHLASMEESCEINYCVKAGALDDKGLPPIQLPPYGKYPAANPYTYNLKSVNLTTGVLWIMNDTTNKWQKMTFADDDQNWLDLQNAELTASAMTRGDATMTGGNVYHHGNDDATTAAIVISSTALLGLIVLAAVYGMCKYKGSRKVRSRSSNITISYENLDDTGGKELEATTDA